MEEKEKQQQPETIDNKDVKKAEVSKNETKKTSKKNSYDSLNKFEACLIKHSQVIGIDKILPLLKKELLKVEKTTSENKLSRKLNISEMGSSRFASGQNLKNFKNDVKPLLNAVSYTHLTLPTKRIV